MPNPLVSIVIPTRNRAESLRQSLKTILAQDYVPIDVLISDNCSDDDTEQVCREMMATDMRIRYVRQPRAIGIHENHNVCMEEARGEFLCLFHDHDRHDPSIVSAYVAFMRAHPRVGIVCADWDLIDDDGVQIGLRDWDGRSVTPGLDYITQTIRAGRSSIGTPGAMVRREALGDTRFGVDAPIGFGDFAIWFRIAETWDVGHISRRLWSWRQNTVSHSARPIQEIANDFERNIGEYCDGHFVRWPGHTELVEQWRTSIRRYLFWALTYEVGLYFRPSGISGGRRTVFEIMDYRLTQDQFDHALAQMKQHRTGAVEHVVWVTVCTLIHLRFTWPLGWMIRYQAVVRTMLGLK